MSSVKGLPMEEKIILKASFNTKVKAYWTLMSVFFSIISIAGIIFTPVIALLVFVISGKKLKATSAHLLERKLVVKRGIFFLVEKSIPLDKITDIALSQGPIMRMFDLHKLSFETAGQSGHGALVSLIGIHDSASFREAILEQKEALMNKDIPSAAKHPTPHSREQNIDDLAKDLKALTQSVQSIEKTLMTIAESKTNQP